MAKSQRNNETNPVALFASVTDPIVKQLLNSIPAAELLAFIEMPEVERITTLSDDTLSREHGDKIEQLSTRRRGMRRVHALLIAAKQQSA
jgi:hypothetical protein